MSGRWHSNWPWLAFAPLLCLGVCQPALLGGDPRLEDIKLPDGFTIEVFAEGVNGARQLCMGDRGTLFVSSRDKNVHALTDEDGDGRPERLRVIAQGLVMPNGVAFKDGSLYVAEVHRILRYDSIEYKLDTPLQPVVVFDRFPTEKHHGWKYIAIGPDGRLYVPVGAPCNICLSQDSIYASITSMELDGTDLRIEANGVRNTVGFDWDPRDGRFWFTDNGRDMMGNDMPSCELNALSERGEHFGYPFCHQGDTLDPEFDSGKDCSDYTAPVLKLGPHVAPLGMKFYRGGMFPDAYRNAIFIAEHGSWNRSTPIGYRVKVATQDAEGRWQQQVFADGWLKGNAAWGRPVDVLELPDGSLLISDDAADMIYRITYRSK
ncbi:MAG: sorbosone dehydrogenase family protein [Flavobacteriales bacterium]|nr:MAG: sorbosone dehydrogenase family protein [Flavobacteriales bacterium]